MAEPPTTHEQYTVAVVFAMEFEMTAFRGMLDEEFEDDSLPANEDDSNEYILGRLGRHNVVLAWLPSEQGIGAAALVGKDLSRTFRSIRWRFLVGIGGGFPSERHDIRLGDVVVSMPDRGSAHGGVVQYDLGKDGEGVFHRKGFLQQPSKKLRAKAIKMQSNHVMRGSGSVSKHVQDMLRRWPSLQPLYERPSGAADVLFADGSTHADGKACENCSASQIRERTPRPDHALLKVHYGLIASGNRVIVSTADRDRIKRSVDGDIICFEMEAGGLAAEHSCMVIRGISDYADPHKNMEWQYWAAANAAACAKELLLLVEPAEVDVRQGSAGLLPEDHSAGAAAAPRRLEDSSRRTHTVQQHQNYGVQINGAGTNTFGDVNIGGPPQRRY